MNNHVSKRGPLKLLGYPLIDLGKLLIRAGAWCLGGRANIDEDTHYE